MRQLHLSIMVVSFGLLAALSACDSTTALTPQMALEVVSGGDQSGVVAAALSQAVAVRVLNAQQRPQVGIEVRWIVIEGGGSVDQPVTLTDTAGRATVRWTLGLNVGSQLLLATASNASTTIRATSRLEVIQVAAGFRHTCALTSTGQAFCWGAGEQGQLGNGAAITSRTPVRVQSLLPFTRIAAGWSHTCALRQNGDAFCWGDNRVEQLGVVSTISGFAIPEPVRFTEHFVDIDLGFVHTCGLTDTGDVLCWGVNQRGQLSGVGTSTGRITGQNFVTVSAGEFHTCGVRADKIVMCWGYNSNGALGTNAPSEAVVTTPTAVADTTHFTSVSAGPRHTCALSANGGVFCWGLNGSGEMGFTPFFNPFAPLHVGGADNFTAVGIGNAHACGLSGQRAYCWGGQPFNGQSADSKTPLPVNTQLQFTSISVGYEHTCGLANGEVWCWGSNSFGQLGQQSIASSVTPVRVSFPSQ